MSKRNIGINLIIATLASLAFSLGFTQAPSINIHNGYWVTEVNKPELPVPMTVINDMHVDPVSKRATVYAQNRVLDQVLAPAQVGPSECTETRNGDTACFHPNAVYLNGSGQELMEEDGTGSWWVKHSWVVDGEGYENCEMKLAETYDDCFWVEGVLLDDDLSMKVGGTDLANEGFFNIRTPLLDESPVRYSVTRFSPKNTDPEVGEVDLTPTAQWELIWDCKEEVSAFDNQKRTCPVAVSTTEQEATNAPLTALRNYRYCEIIPVYRERLTLRMEVFNTLSFNECPADLWQTIDAETLKKDLGALEVVVNGPRYWVLDELVGEGGITSEGVMANFNGIDMALRGVLEASVMGNVVGDELYTPNTIARSTRYTFYENELVYLLIDPLQGDVYIMQSYSQGIDPDLSIDDLATLGHHLELPEGWRYEAVRLSKEFVLSSGGQTTVINDDFANTYQRIPTQALIPNF